MNKFVPKTRDGEKKIQQALIKLLRSRGWFVQVIGGNKYQNGLPDLFICQRAFGYRWLECKQPVKYVFTESQVEDFPKLAKNDIKIWVLTAATETEYKKLFEPPNWERYFTANHWRIKERSPEILPQGDGEAAIHRDVLKTLRADGWFAKTLAGTIYQQGMPDIFACKKGHGFKFIEVKQPRGYRFTPAQLEIFPRLQSEGVGVWIVNKATETLDVINSHPNWHKFL